MQRLFRYLKPFRLPILVTFVLLFVQSISQLYLPTLMANIVDIGIARGDTAYIMRVGGVMVFVAALGALCTIAATYLSSTAASGFGKNLRAAVFERVEEFSLHEFDRFGTSSLITRTTNDITQVQQVVSIGLRMMVSAPMMAVGGVIMAVSRDARLSLVLLVIIPLIMLGVYIVAGRVVGLFRSMQAKLDTLNRVLRESLTGIRVVRAFNRVEHDKARFHEANLDLTTTAIRIQKVMAGLMPLMMIMLNFTTIALVWFGTLRIARGHLQVGDLMAFIQYIMQIMQSLIMVSMMFVMIPRASASATRINEVLDVDPGIVDPALPVESSLLRGHVQFDNVTFSYPGAEQPAISNISFSARSGEVTAIIGGTGSGKSTLINLIPRFYDVDSGVVKVNGVDVREWKQEDLRRIIGFVPQQAVLFTGSIADNIRYGRETATELEVVQAAEISQAHDFIGSLQDGYGHTLAQGGTNISGGQKQRLSIARALIKKPEVYIFDDSFSALDFKTDAKLRAALKGETANSTVIIVAQRISTVMDADQIVVLDEGKITGVGTHRELLKSCSVYREIIASQLSEEELA